MVIEKQGKIRKMSHIEMACYTSLPKIQKKMKTQRERQKLDKVQESLMGQV